VGRARIAIDVSPVMDRPLTGVGWRCLHLVNALLERRDEVEYCLFAARARKTPRGEFPFPQAEGAAVVPYFRRLKTMLWPTVERPPIEWFTGPVDAAHGMFHDLPASRRAFRIATIHDLSFLRFPETHTAATIRTQTRLVHHCAARADGLIAVSEAVKSELLRTFEVAPDSVAVVPGGVHLADYQAPLDQEALQRLRARLGLEEQYFIHLGTVEPRKNLVRLLEAYAQCIAHRPDAPMLLLVGARGWKSDPIFEAIERLRLEERVLHPGYLNREDAVLALKGAAALVYPSLYEGFGLPVLEAMAAGVPILASTDPALMELTEGAAVHVDPHSVEALLSGMERVWTDQEGNRHRTAAALERARARTWTHSAEKLAQVYARAVQRQSLAAKGA
jgi:glycosyltransferase involved in cell wall biosynthesis